MSVTAGSLSILLPIIERLTRLPGKALVVAAGLLNALVLIVGWNAGRSSDAAISWMPFVGGVFFAIATLVFAVLRHRLESRVEQTAERFSGEKPGPVVTVDDVGTQSSNQGLIVYTDDGRKIHGPNPHALSEEEKRIRNQQRMTDARAQAADKRDTFMPRVDAAQRAAIAAAGGVKNAPYLKDDLRVTIVSTLLTMASIPTGLFLLLLGVAIWA